MKTKIIAILAITSLMIWSCRKDPVEPAHTHDETPAATTGSLKLEFEAMVDTNALVFNTQNYLNANGDTFKVSTFKYYISNVVLTKSDNSTYTEPNSYHLIDHATPSSVVLTIPNVPVGSYKAVTFMIGVDSTRNVSGVQSGDLDPTKGMFWSWSSGYIMAKLEGSSPQSGATTKNLTFHIGGFQGANNVLKTVSPTFGTETANVSGTTTPEIHLKTDISQWFKSPTTTNFGTTHTVHMPGTTAKTIADNYADMFTVEHIHN